MRHAALRHAYEIDDDLVQVAQAFPNAANDNVAYGPATGLNTYASVGGVTLSYATVGLPPSGAIQHDGTFGFYYDAAGRHTHTGRDGTVWETMVRDAFGGMFWSERIIAGAADVGRFCPP